MEIDFSQITDVKVDEKTLSKQERLFIDFCLNGKANFYIGFVNKENCWKPLKIYHNFLNKASTCCRICGRRTGTDSICFTLSEDYIEIGEWLLKHPNVRLRLLFM